MQNDMEMILIIYFVDTTARESKLPDPKDDEGDELAGGRI